MCESAGLGGPRGPVLRGGGTCAQRPCGRSGEPGPQAGGGVCAPVPPQSPGTQLSSPLLCHPAKDGPSAAPNTPQMAPRRPALVQAQVRPRPTLLCCPEGLTEKLGLQRPPTHHCHLHTCRPHPRPRLGRRALSRFRDVSREGWQWYRGALKRGLLAGHGATASGTMRSLAAAT